MKKKFLPLLVAVCATSALWANGIEIDGIHYILAGDSAVVTYTCDDWEIEASTYSGDIVVPSSVTYGQKEYSVTGIGQGAFTQCTNLLSITIPSSVKVIGSCAFERCISLTSITIPKSVIGIEGHTFYGCIHLHDIYCFVNPNIFMRYEEYQGHISEYPYEFDDIFEKVSKHCYIHVPKGTIQEYQFAPVWREFYHIIEISDLPAGQTEVGVTVTNNYATFSWPVNPTASSYTLEIKKGGVLFCTLVFNNMGQLVGMSFAPGRGANQAPAAESTSYGYSFVVTGLTAYTTYDYTFTTLDSQGSILETKNGTFETTEITAIENVNDNRNHNRKVIRNGVLLIERNGVYYNAQGAVVE